MDFINVVELFAGVGGFRLGLEQSSPRFRTIWANQWEPGKKSQHAFDCYVANFGQSPNHINEDIAKVKGMVPNHDLLVGGFPCQDYSVARTGAQGIQGKKGVLWWEIRDIIELRRPRFVLLENVDRLIKSPGFQRGRDFGVMLRCLNDLGYAVEWRVINAAEYNQPQRRRRVFILAYRNDTALYQQLNNHSEQQRYREWLIDKGFYADIFPVKTIEKTKKIYQSSLGPKEYLSLVELSNEFKSPFYNSGFMINGLYYTEELQVKNPKSKSLRSIRYRGFVDEKYFLGPDLSKWEFLKGAKKIKRIRPNGEPYYFSEGGMSFPDNLDLPGRTMLTSESSVNRSTHVIEDLKTGKLRLLIPIECERLNGFPDNWTNTGMPESFRYFVMGNALVVPIVREIGSKLLQYF